MQSEKTIGVYNKSLEKEAALMFTMSSVTDGQMEEQTATWTPCMQKGSHFEKGP